MIPRDHDFTRWYKVTDQAGHVVPGDLCRECWAAPNGYTGRPKRSFRPLDPVIFDKAELFGRFETGGDIDMPCFSHDGWHGIAALPFD
jgi:hypothetical protein